MPEDETTVSFDNGRYYAEMGRTGSQLAHQERKA
jgi:hypothetical protein